MTDEKIDLLWGKFTWQLLLCAAAFISAAWASSHIFGSDTERLAFSEHILGAPIGAFLIMGPFLYALRIMRVPYKTDMFERRLRNWCMTYAAIITFMLSVAANIGYQSGAGGPYLITPYMMPAIWLIAYVIYAQYTRYCIAHGRRNSFLDGNRC